RPASPEHSKCSRLKSKHMPWQEVLQTLGNCHIFGRIMYCGEKCWIQRDSLLPGDENVSACLPSRASRVRVPSPAPSRMNSGFAPTSQRRAARLPTARFTSTFASIPPLRADFYLATGASCLQAGCCAVARARWVARRAAAGGRTTVPRSSPQGRDAGVVRNHVAWKHENPRAESRMTHEAHDKRRTVLGETMDTSATTNAWRNHDVSNATFGGGADASNFWRHGTILYIGYRSAFQEEDARAGYPHAKRLRLVALDLHTKQVIWQETF